VRGILSAAGYVPYRRLARADIKDFMGSGGGKGTRAVASHDEDTTTLGVEAARLAMRSVPGHSPESLWFATSVPAYLDKTNATAVAAALRLPGDVGAYDFGGMLTDSMTAHPKICPNTGELHFFGAGNIFEPHVSYHRADADGRLTISRPIDVPALTLMHDFALTAEHVVFLDLPLLFDLRVALGGSFERDLPYRWDDQYRARLGVLRRDDPYGQLRWFDIDPCFVFHVVNAHDVTARGENAIALEVLRYDEMWRHNSEFGTDAALWRWTINLDTGVVEESQLDDRGVEFPRIDDRLAGTSARYSVAVGSDALIRYDLQRDTAVEHRFDSAGEAGAPGEAVFAPAIGRPDELAGWYLTYVYNSVTDSSDLVVIDASDFEGEPVARIRMPRRVPHGFHGNWIAD